MMSEVGERPTLIMGGYKRHSSQWVKGAYLKFSYKLFKKATFPNSKISRNDEQKQDGKNCSRSPQEANFQ